MSLAAQPPVPPARRTPASSGRVELRSDNAAGVAPEILAALVQANDGSALAYGGDQWTARLRERVRTVFDHPAAEVFPVLSGTAANALALSAMTPPWGAVLCHDEAHIIDSEAGATSLLSSGAVLIGLPGRTSRIDPEALRARLAATRWGDPHASQPSVLSLTCPTEAGAVYTPAEIGQLSAMARERGLRVHLDGARIAGALAHLGCSPADLTWRAGVDAVSLGATKNGALSTDAILVFDPAIAAELRYRTKRAGHVASKLRFQSVQLDRYLADGLWLDLAGRANRAMARLYSGLLKLGLSAPIPPQVNLVLLELSARHSDALAAAGVDFHRIGGQARFVTSFLTSTEEVDRVVAALADA